MLFRINYFDENPLFFGSDQMDEEDRATLDQRITDFISNDDNGLILIGIGSCFAFSGVGLSIISSLFSQQVGKNTVYLGGTMAFAGVSTIFSVLFRKGTFFNPSENRIPL